jgi:hypothetical protein
MGRQYRLTLPGAPATAHYVPGKSCAFGNPGALSVMMGLSVGWGDQYSASTNFQWIDTTGLPNGRSRLTATAIRGTWSRRAATPTTRRGRTS